MKNGYGNEYSSYHKLAFLFLNFENYALQKYIYIFFRGIAEIDKERIPKTPEEFNQAR